MYRHLGTLGALLLMSSTALAQVSLQTPNGDVKGRIDDPAARATTVSAVARKIMTQIYAGKVDPKLLTAAGRIALAPAKVRKMRKELLTYGKMKSIKLTHRKPATDGDVCTFKVIAGDSSIIATMTITKADRLETFLLIEE